MKKFNFRLQKVLDVKEMVIRKTQRDLAYAQDMKALEEKKLQKLQETLALQYQELQESASGTAADILLKYDYFYQLLDDVKAKKQDIVQIDQKIAQIRHQLQNQQKERKILSKLKEKSLENYVTEFRREEQILLDEVAVIASR